MTMNYDQSVYVLMFWRKFKYTKRISNASLYEKGRCYDAVLVVLPYTKREDVMMLW